MRLLKVSSGFRAALDTAMRVASSTRGIVRPMLSGTGVRLIAGLTSGKRGGSHGGENNGEHGGDNAESRVIKANI